MKELIGTATLHYLGEPRPVQVRLDFEKNVVEARYATGDMAQALSGYNSDAWLRTPAVLKDVRLASSSKTAPRIGHTSSK